MGRNGEKKDDKSDDKVNDKGLEKRDSSIDGLPLDPSINEALGKVMKPEIGSHFQAPYVKGPGDLIIF